MMSEAIYRTAVHELFQRTYGKLEGRDEIKVVQLFDRLLTAGHSLHVDELRHTCTDAGYDESTADHIGHLYDTLCLIRRDVDTDNAIDYWPPEQMQRILLPERQGD